MAVQGPPHALSTQETVTCRDCGIGPETRPPVGKHGEGRLHLQSADSHGTKSGRYFEVTGAAGTATQGDATHGLTQDRWPFVCWRRRRRCARPGGAGLALAETQTPTPPAGSAASTPSASTSMNPSSSSSATTAPTATGITRPIGGQARWFGAPRREAGPKMRPRAPQAHCE